MSIRVYVLFGANKLTLRLGMRMREEGKDLLGNFCNPVLGSLSRITKTFTKFFSFI